MRIFILFIMFFIFTSATVFAQECKYQRTIYCNEFDYICDITQKFYSDKNVLSEYQKNFQNELVERTKIYYENQVKD